MKPTMLLAESVGQRFVMGMGIEAVDPSVPWKSMVIVTLVSRVIYDERMVVSPAQNPFCSLCGTPLKVTAPELIRALTRPVSPLLVNTSWVVPESMMATGEFIVVLPDTTAPFTVIWEIYSSVQGSDEGRAQEKKKKKKKQGTTHHDLVPVISGDGNPLHRAGGEGRVPAAYPKVSLFAGGGRTGEAIAQLQTKAVGDPGVVQDIHNDWEVVWRQTNESANFKKKKKEGRRTLADGLIRHAHDTLGIISAHEEVLLAGDTNRS